MKNQGERKSGARPAARAVGYRLERGLPFLRWGRRMTPATLRADLIAGVTGAIIVLPQGVAYAFIAGLPPEYGLYTAIIPAVLAALFGSSWHSVTGPTAANSIVVLGTVSALALPGSSGYIQAVLALTLMVGVLQLALALLRLGVVMNFISDTVVIGFTAGAAVLIAVSQLGYLLGLDLPENLSFFATLETVAMHLGETNPYDLAVGLTALGVGLAVQYFNRRWPALLIGMLVSGILAALIGAEARGVEMVGRLPEGLPAFALPAVSLEQARTLASGALALAMLGLMQAMSAARAVAIRSRQRLDSNQEFVGQGVANFVGAFFSCYAASGSFTRSGANYDAGARTPLSAIVAAGIVLFVLLLIPGATRYLALPAMAGIVLLIAWNLIDVERIRRTVRISRSESLVLGVTFAATLLLHLEFAIYVGVLLSLFLFLRRASRPRLVPVAPVPDRPGFPLRSVARLGLNECTALKIVRIDGSLFFGAVDHVQDYLYRLSEQGYRHVLLVGSGVDYLDLAAAEMLAQEAERFRALGGGLYFSNFKAPAAAMLRHPAFRFAIGEEAIFSSAQAAVRAILTRLDQHECDPCPLAVYLNTAQPPETFARTRPEKGSENA